MDGWVTAGRAAAFCAHPVPAWRRLTTGRRALLVGVSAGLGYAVTLAFLLAV